MFFTSKENQKVMSISLTTKSILMKGLQKGNILPETIKWTKCIYIPVFCKYFFSLYSQKPIPTDEPVKVKEVIVSKPVVPQNKKHNFLHNYQGICLIEGVDVPNSFVILCQTSFSSNIIDVLEVSVFRMFHPVCLYFQ